jgi:hypothetical protein
MAIPARFSPRSWSRRRAVAVRSTLNVGALDLTGCSRVRLPEPNAAWRGA